jgi:hypothetical protein
MGNKVTILFALAFLLVASTVKGQDGNYNFNIQALGGYTTHGVVPFWLRSNQYGSIPLDGASLSLIGSARKDYDLSRDKIFDWGASFEGRANLGQGSNLTLIEGYGKIRLSIFEFRAGRSKQIMGLCDTMLTSGSWAVSGTNLGIPEVEVSIPEFFIIPGLGQLFAFKGNFSHGWMGVLPLGATPWSRYEVGDTVRLVSYLHQKSLYGRFGKPSWRLKLYGGFNHQVVWGHEQGYYNDDYTLSPLETYFYVTTGKRYSNGSIHGERQGNHLGSIDIGIEYRFDKVKLFLYRQNFYEAGALAHLANIQDGLNGISIENKQQDDKAPIWNKLLFEVLYTKNQAGRIWSPEYGSPYEPYYNHGQYITGWSYLGTGLGTPFISTRSNIRAELPSAPEEYFINNRVMAFHLGFVGSMKSFNYILKASWAQNYGTYWTTDEEQSTDIPNPGGYGIFGKQEQLSTYLELNRTINNGLNLGLIGAFDYGDLLYNSFGVFLKASYSIYLPKPSAP